MCFPSPLCFNHNLFAFCLFCLHVLVPCRTVYVVKYPVHNKIERHFSNGVTEKKPVIKWVHEVYLFQYSLHTVEDQTGRKAETIR